MIFFTGMDKLTEANRVPAAFISARVLHSRKSHFPVRWWVLDSGAFTAIQRHGGYPEPEENYIELIRRFKSCGRLLAAVSQDYLCDPMLLKKTGLSVAEHQRLTIARYDRLMALNDTGVYLMPVLQGQEIPEYLSHLQQYGDRLPLRAWVGIGSVVKRSSYPTQIRDLLAAIHAVRPDLRLHGFGIKLACLRHRAIRELLFSADSMAWRFGAWHAKREGRTDRDPRDVRNAIEYGQLIRDLIYAPVEGFF